jgi:hypothetical protein
MSVEGKWISFTRVGRERKFITKLFSTTYISISYKTNDTTEITLGWKHGEYVDKYRKTVLML